MCHSYRKARFIWVLAAIILSLTACHPQLVSTPVPTPVDNTRNASASSSTEVIKANGIVQPLRRVTLGFAVQGRVESVDVEIGDLVTGGQTLARLDTEALERAVSLAALDLERCQVQLAHIEAQATPVPERIAAATTAIDSAESVLASARARATQQENQDIIDRAALTDAEQALRDAQQAYENLLESAVTRDWAPYSPAAKAVEDAQDHYNVTLAQYKLHTADRSYEVAIAQAEEQLARARLARYDARHPLGPGQLVEAQLAVTQAELSLQFAQADLDKATLVAPFAGPVAAVTVAEEEWTTPGVPVLEILDTSRWRIATKNVGELQISQVRVGQRAVVRVNAFREEVLDGRVVTVSPVAVVQQGDTTYTLMIELEPTSLNLRPGMTAQVEIITDDGS